MKQWAPRCGLTIRSAALVKGDVRLPLPVGKTQYFELEPFTHWPGNETEEITPGEWRLFKCGPTA